jgi:hypothetical protein
MSIYKSKVFKCLQELNYKFDYYLYDSEQRERFQYYCYLLSVYFGVITGMTYLSLGDRVWNIELQDIGWELSNDEKWYTENTKELQITEEAKEFLNIIKKEFIDLKLLRLFCVFKYFQKQNKHITVEDIWNRFKDTGFSEINEEIKENILRVNDKLCKYN